MKKRVFLLIFLVFSFLLNADEIKYEFKSNYGFSSNNSLLSNFKDARVAISVWLEEIGKTHNGKLDIKFYDDIEVMYKKFKETTSLDMIVVDLPFYFANKKEIEKISNNVWSIAYGKNKYVQYYFVANKKSKIKNFSDIEDKVAALKMHEKGVRVWLDKNSYQENQKSYKNVVRAITIEKKESTALLKVFFNKADFSIISSRTWETMVELNPAIKKRVEIVKKSERIHLPFIGFFSKKASKAGVKAFFELSDDMRALPESEQIITLLKFETVFRVEENSLLELEDCYNEYFSLEKKYR